MINLWVAFFLVVGIVLIVVISILLSQGSKNNATTQLFGATLPSDSISSIMADNITPYNDVGTTIRGNINNVTTEQTLELYGNGILLVREKLNNKVGNYFFKVTSKTSVPVTYSIINVTNKNQKIKLSKTVKVTFIGLAPKETSTIDVLKKSTPYNVGTSIIVTIIINGNPVPNQRIQLIANSDTALISKNEMTGSDGKVTFDVTSTKIENVIFTAKNITNTMGKSFPPVTVSFTPKSDDSSTMKVDNTSAYNDIGTTIRGQIIGVTDKQTLELYGNGVLLVKEVLNNTTGNYFFKVTSKKAEAVTYSIINVTQKTQLSKTVTVNFLGLAPKDTSTIAALKKSTPCNVGTSIVVTIIIDDKPVPNQTITLTANSDTTNISQNNLRTNSDGKATFNVTSTKKEDVIFTAKNIDNSMGISLPPVTVSFTLKSDDSSTMKADNTSAYNDIGTTIRGQIIGVTDKQTLELYGNGVILVKEVLNNTTGNYLFKVTSKKAEAVTYSIINVTQKTELSNTVTVNFLGLAPKDTSTIASLKKSTPCNVGTSIVVTIIINDKPVPNQTITLTANSDTTKISQNNLQTNSDGKATFSVTSTKKEDVIFTAKNTTNNMGISLPPVTVSFTSNLDERSTMKVDNTSVYNDVGTTIRGQIVGVTAKQTLELYGNGVLLVKEVLNNTTGNYLFKVTSKKAERETVTYSIINVTQKTELSNTVTVNFIGLWDTSTITAITSPTPFNVGTSITVTIINAGKPVANQMINLTTQSSTTTITPYKVKTGSNGIATFNVKSTKKEDVIFTAINTTNKKTVRDTVTVSFVESSTPITCTAKPGSYCDPGKTVSKLCPRGSACEGGTKQPTACDDFLGMSGDTIIPVGAKECSTDVKDLPGGSYKKTCTDCTIVDGFLYCKCETGENILDENDIPDKIVKPTNTNMSVCASRSFTNIDGNLTCEGSDGPIDCTLDPNDEEAILNSSCPAGNYIDSCNCQLYSDGIISCWCDDTEQNSSNTNIVMNDCPSRSFTNKNGVLTCDTVVTKITQKQDFTEIPHSYYTFEHLKGQ